MEHWLAILHADSHFQVVVSHEPSVRITVKTENKILPNGQLRGNVKLVRLPRKEGLERTIRVEGIPFFGIDLPVKFRRARKAGRLDKDLRHSHHWSARLEGNGQEKNIR